MPLNYSYTNANQNSADYRIAQRPTPATKSARIERLQQWLADRRGYEWTRGYKEAEQELKELEGAN